MSMSNYILLKFKGMHGCLERIKVRDSFYPFSFKIHLSTIGSPNRVRCLVI